MLNFVIFNKNNNIPSPIKLQHIDKNLNKLNIIFFNKLIQYIGISINIGINQLFLLILSKKILPILTPPQ